MSMGSWSWWVKNIIIGFFSVFFLVFGLEVLIGSYGLKHPEYFIMYFFSGSFIILISLIGILYPFLQLYAFLRRPEPLDHDE